MKYNILHPHCGPFNSIDKNRPDDPVDAVCWEHDKGYEQMLKRGQNPYLTWNRHDAMFVEQLELLKKTKYKDYAGVIYKKFFEVKKAGHQMWRWMLPFVAANYGKGLAMTFEDEKSYEAPYTRKVKKRNKGRGYKKIKKGKPAESGSLPSNVKQPLAISDGRKRKRSTRPTNSRGWYRNKRKQASKPVWRIKRAKK